MRRSELVVLAYLGYLVLLAWMLPLSTRKRCAATFAAGLIASLVALLAWLPASPVTTLARDWLPALYLVAGYWLSGLFFTRAMPSAEAWLLEADRRLLSLGALRPLLEGRPRPIAEYFEGAYLGCYVLVPAGLGVLYGTGAAEQADRYWTTVLLAEYGCYGMLPWVRTRPPRSIEGPAPAGRGRLALGRLNAWILRHGSIQVNTVPSGHAAGGLAAALMVWSVDPRWGLLFLVAAVSIAIGSVVGRYHYTADAILGFAWALAAWWLAA
jgi:hypothetical protein